MQADLCWRSSIVEHLFRKQEVGGASPPASSISQPRSIVGRAPHKGVIPVRLRGLVPNTCNFFFKWEGVRCQT